VSKKPTYSLVKGDVFIGSDLQAWTVDEVVKPEGWNTLPQIGEKPKVWEVRAHRGQANRRFYYHGTRLVEVK